MDNESEVCSTVTPVLPKWCWTVALYSKTFNFLFTYFWLCWVFVTVHGLFLVSEQAGGYFSWWCMGFSLQWASSATEHRL